MIFLYSPMVIALEQLVRAQAHLAREWEIPATWVKVSLAPTDEVGRYRPEVVLEVPDNASDFLFPGAPFLTLSDEDRAAKILHVVRFTEGELRIRLDDYDACEQEDALKVRAHDPRTSIETLIPKKAKS